MSDAVKEKKPKVDKATAVWHKFEAARAEMKKVLIDRNDEIDLVLTALVAREHPLLVGPPGCLHPDTPIHDPVDGTTETVFRRYLAGAEFHVTALDENTGRLVVTRAEAPWEYPTAEMFRVTTEGGRSFTVTGGHRVWTGAGYVTISEVRERLARGEPVRLPTTSDTGRPARTQGVPRSTGTPEGSPAGCSAGSRQRGGRPQTGGDTDQASSPRRDDVPQRNRQVSPQGGPDGGGSGTAQAALPHRPTPGCSPLSGLPTAFVPERPRTEGSSEPYCGSFPEPQPSARETRDVGTSSPDGRGLSRATEGGASSDRRRDELSTLATPDTFGEHPRRPSGSSRTEQRSPSASDLPTPAGRLPGPGVVCAGPLDASEVLGQDDHIIGVEPAGSSPYYDFHVPGYENYLTGGVIHHNTGKSLLLDSVGHWMGTAKVFNVLMSKHTTPEELFGPVSVIGLKNDQYRRITTGMLPEADLAFVDEIWKSSSATLNTLLRLLNERTFVNGDGVHRPCPLVVCLAASNEWPDGKELGALFDRFLIRKKVSPIRSPHGRIQLLFGAKEHVPQFADTVTRADLDLARSAAKALPWAKEAKDGFLEILEKLNGEGVVPGDRRVFKSRDVVRAAAWLEGTDEVVREHLDVLKHTLWDDPAEQPEVAAKVVGKIANPTGFLVGEKLAAARDVVANSSPNDAVVKLKQIRKELEKSGSRSPSVTHAIAEIQAMTKACYDKVIGEDDDA